MKIQDIAFFAVLILMLLLSRKSEKLFVVFGLGALFVSIPLFYFQIFFTAQRLIYYAWAFLLLSVLISLFNNKNYEDRN